jgi:hypothetical protein
MTTLLEAALAYAAAHLPVFPLIPGSKEPAIKGGFHAATTNPETIKRLWRIGDCNIGMPTGPASGIWGVDVDPGGEENIRRLEADNAALPATRTVTTPRGGKHIWFKYTGPVPSTADKIAPSIDTRGDGGYVVVPPSVGPAGRAYSWSSDPKAELATAPDWLTALARRKPTISERAVTGIRQIRGNAFISNGGHCSPSENSPAYGGAALDREIAELATTPAGRRNHRLNYTAFRLFQLVAGGELDERGVEDRLIEACERNGLIADDGLRSIEKTIASGRAAGLQSPRSRKGAT